MKIVGFSQLRNEYAKGNLINWFNCMNRCCDSIYIYDQASDDGSTEYYKTQEKAKVILSNKNDFINELLCKQQLLSKLKNEESETDWIFWVDGDTLVDERAMAENCKNLRNTCEVAISKGATAIKLGHYNLWRSDIYYRTDNNYHDLHGNVVALWKNTNNLSFINESGLHKLQYPISAGTNLISSPISLIHRGFATDYQIITKYNVYKERGQLGWALDRLLDENTLKVERLPENILPKDFVITDEINPTVKRKIREIYSRG